MLQFVCTLGAAWDMMTTSLWHGSLARIMRTHQLSRGARV